MTRQTLLALYRYKTALDALASHVDVGRRLLAPIFTGDGPLDSAAAEAALEAVGDHPLALYEDSRDVNGITDRALTDVFAAFNYADDVMRTTMAMACAIKELGLLRQLVLDGYGEDSLTPVAVPVRKLTPNIRGYFGL